MAASPPDDPEPELRFDVESGEVRLVRPGREVEVIATRNANREGIIAYLVHARLVDEGWRLPEQIEANVPSLAKSSLRLLPSRWPVLDRLVVRTARGWRIRFPPKHISVDAEALAKRMAAPVDQGVVRRTWLVAPPPPFKTDYVERRAHQERLIARLLRPAPSPMAITGLPGVGKTTLLQHVVNDPRIVERFPDGVLWLVAGPSAAIEGVVQRAALMLGLRLKPVQHGRSFLHGTLAGKQLLLVVDDAWNADVARAVSLGDESVAHVVSTRFHRVADDYAGPMEVLELPEFTKDEVAHAVAQLQLSDREERERLAAILTRVGGLPWLVAVVTRRIRSCGNSRRRRRAVLTEMERPASEWEVLGNPHQHLIAAGVAALRPQARRALDLLLLLPPKPARFSEMLVTRIAKIGEGVLDELTDSGLVEESGDTAFTVHPAIRELASGTEPGRRVAWMRRILERCAEALPELAESAGPFADDAASVIQFMQEANTHQHMGKLTKRVARLLFEPLDRHGLYHLAEAVLRLAMDESEPTDAEAASVLHDLGRLMERCGRYGEAEQLLERAADAWRRLENPGKVAACLATIGTAALQQGDHGRAARLYEEALQTCPPDDALRRAAALQGLAAARHYAGRFDLALEAYTQAYDLARSREDLRSIVPALLYSMCLLAISRGDLATARSRVQTALEASATGEQRALSHTGLGMVALELGDLAQAERNLLDALHEVAGVPHPKRIAVAQEHLATVYRRQGRFDDAEQVLAEAVTELRAIGQTYDLAQALLESARLAIDRGDPETAERAITEAEQMAERFGFTEIQIETSEAQAMLAHERGQDAVARHLAEDAIRRYSAIGHHRADALREWLGRLDA